MSPPDPAGRCGCGAHRAPRRPAHSAVRAGTPIPFAPPVPAAILVQPRAQTPQHLRATREHPRTGGQRVDHEQRREVGLLVEEHEQLRERRADMRTPILTRAARARALITRRSARAPARLARPRRSPGSSPRDPRTRQHRPCCRRHPCARHCATDAPRPLIFSIDELGRRRAPLYLQHPRALHLGHARGALPPRDTRPAPRGTRGARGIGALGDHATPPGAVARSRWACRPYACV